MAVPFRIARIGMREIHLPLLEPFRTSTGVVEARRVVLLELASGDGATAWSECVAEAVPSYSPDTVDSCWLAIAEWLGPRILGRELAGPGAAYALLNEGVRGHRMAIAAVEMGAWALAAARERLPLAALLGRASRAGAAPRPAVATGISLGIHATPEQLATRAAGCVREGYRRIKMKIEPGRDVAFVRAVRDVVGDEVPLTADANSAYRLDDASHVEALMALDAFGLSMIEQPLAHDDLRRHAELQRRLHTRICLDESITGFSSAEDMLAMASGRVVNIKPGRVGGFAQSVAIHDLCAEAKVPVWCGGMLETGIGRAYNVALASLPNFSEPGDLSPSRRYWARDITTPSWEMDDGFLRVPLDRPGIGVEPDLAFIDQLTVRSRVLE